MKKALFLILIFGLIFAPSSFAQYFCGQTIQGRCQNNLMCDGSNILKNSGFESDRNADNIPDGYIFDGDLPSDVVIDKTQKFVGENSVKVTGIWNSIIIAKIIKDEFGVNYHQGHVRKLLRQIGFSVQRPTVSLIRAEEKTKNRWIRYTFPNLKKSLKKKAAPSSTKTKRPSAKIRRSTKHGRR